MKYLACLLSLVVVLALGQSASAHGLGSFGGLGVRAVGFNAGLGGGCGSVAAVPSFGFQQQAFLAQGVAPVVAQPNVIVLNQRAAFGGVGGLGVLNPFLGRGFAGRLGVGIGGRGLNRNFAVGRGIPRLKR